MITMVFRLLLSVSFISMFCQICFAQLSIDVILSNADNQRQIYQETFKNLFANEIKTLQTFKADGGAAKTRRIESNFLVYQSQINSQIISEFRNVTRVDNKEIANNQRSTEAFFGNLLRSKNTNEEMARINSENSKYDVGLNVNGLTLLQTPVLAEHIRPYFTFRLLRVEDGKYVVGYQQLKNCPFVLLNDSNSNETKLTMDFGVKLPVGIIQPNPRVRGKIWIDMNSFQIWREERELTIQPNGSATPLSVFYLNFDYMSDNLPILVPQKIILDSFFIKDQDKTVVSTKNARLVYEYSRFAGADVKVKTSGMLEPVLIVRKATN